MFQWKNGKNVGSVETGGGWLSGWTTDPTNYPEVSNNGSPLQGAIINRPSLLLADEPTGALDSTTAEVLELFDELHHQGITLVMVTHEDDVAARAKRVVSFQDGRVKPRSLMPDLGSWPNKVLLNPSWSPLLKMTHAFAN